MDFGSEAGGENQEWKIDPSGTVYSPLLKRRVLRVLIGFSLKSGLRWAAIRREILETVGIDLEDTRLIRQDLEAWERRPGSLGNEKFRLVYSFLKHPKTRNRPEFAKELLELFSPENEIIRVGKVFDEFSGLSSYHRATWPSEILDQISGCYEALGSHFSGRTYLNLQRVANELFMLAHVIVLRPTHDRLIDKNVQILGGIATAADDLRIFVRDPVTMQTLHLRLLPDGIVLTGVTPRYRFFARADMNGEEVYEDIEYIRIGGTGESIVSAEIIEFVPGMNVDVMQIVDNIGWNL